MISIWGKNIEKKTTRTHTKTLKEVTLASEHLMCSLFFFFSEWKEDGGKFLFSEIAIKYTLIFVPSF